MDIVARATPDGTLMARADAASDVVSFGLDRVARWTELLAGDRPGPGRGVSTVVSLSSGRRVHLKQLRRGGALASMWRERFVGSGRIARNLSVPLAAIERGVSTPSPVAVLIVPGPPGLDRGWLAVGEIAGAVDLRSRLAEAPPPGDDTLRAVLGVVRVAHDAGLVHPDLNIGNVMVRDRQDPDRAWIIDLDGARIWSDPLPMRRRITELRRLERSYQKWFGPDGPLGGDVRRRWAEWYAAGNRALGDALGV
jgi:hypothetical protein